MWEIDAEEIELDVVSRLEEGRGKLGAVSRELPTAIGQSETEAIRHLLGEDR